MAIDHLKIVNKTAADVIVNYINTSSDSNVPQDPEPLRPIITSGTCIKFNQSDFELDNFTNFVSLFTLTQFYWTNDYIKSVT